jgi:hypothetical protein
MDSPHEYRSRLRALIETGVLPEREGSDDAPSSASRGKRIPGNITEGHKEAMREIERLFLLEHGVADQEAAEE